MITARTPPPRKAHRLSVRPDATATAAMHKAMRECVDHIAANVAGAAAGIEPEYLHQLRVGMRRLRAALRASSGLWRKKDVRALRRPLDALRAASGPVRDLDVIMDLLPASSRPDARARRRTAQAALARLLRTLPPWRLPRAAEGDAPTVRAFARRTLSRLDRKATQRGSRTDWSDADARHALRTRLRRLRYACEFLMGAFPQRDAAPLIDTLKDLQDLLGQLNDLVVARRVLRELSRGSSAASARERALIARLPAAWRRFAAAPRFWREHRP